MGLGMGAGVQCGFTRAAQWVCVLRSLVQGLWGWVQGAVDQLGAPQMDQWQEERVA